MVQEELHRFRETIGSLRWDDRLTAPASTVCPVSTAAPTSVWRAEQVVGADGPSAGEPAQGPRVARESQITSGGKG